MIEKVIFSMPDDPEMFLAALSAVQSWQREQDRGLAASLLECEHNESLLYMALQQGRIDRVKFTTLLQKVSKHRSMYKDLSWEVTIHLPSPEYDVFKPAFGKVNFVYEYKPTRGQWDLAHAFDTVRAYELGSVTERHAAIAFGMLIGSDPGSLPDLSALEITNDDLTDVLVDPWSGCNEIVSKVAAAQPPRLIDAIQPGDSLAKKYAKVSNTEMVVGMRSVATYMAAALGKRVVELYLDDVHRRWLSKWDSKNYQMLYGKSFPADMIWKVMEQLWARPVSVPLTSDPEYRTAMGLRTSVVGSAAKLLPDQVGKNWSGA